MPARVLPLAQVSQRQNRTVEVVWEVDTPAACLMELIGFCASEDAMLGHGLRSMLGEAWPQRSLS